jgi:NAD(P) transhydrogenase subunit alpha
MQSTNLVRLSVAVLLVALVGFYFVTSGTTVASVEPVPATDSTSLEKSTANNSVNNSAINSATKHGTSNRREVLAASLTIFVLAIFVGFEVIAKVPTTLHTPLMSGSNAISGIAVVGALIAASEGWTFAALLGVVAVILAMINVVGGFMVTHRMLAMFQRKKK